MQGKILNLLLLWSGKIPQNSDEKLKSKLEKIDAESVSALEKLPLKNPNIAIILCIFLGAFGKLSHAERGILLDGLCFTDIFCQPFAVCYSVVARCIIAIV